MGPRYEIEIEHLDDGRDEWAASIFDVADDNELVMCVSVSQLSDELQHLLN